MKRFHLSVTPWAAPDIKRTVAFSERHTLWDVHRCIQQEFELGDHHLWAFYLSGEFFDRDSEFGPGDGSASPEVPLGELSLVPGMKFAYLFDFGDELRHGLHVDLVEDTDAPAERPEVIARVGNPPRQYGAFKDEAAEPPTAPPPLPDGVEPLLDEGWNLVDEARVAAADPDLRGRAFELTRRLLELHPPSEVPKEVVARFLGEVGPLLEELLHALDTSGDLELDALQERVARLARSDRHAHGFAPQLCADVRLLLMRYRGDELELADRLKRIPPADLARVGQAILEACPTPSRLAELGCELQSDQLPDLLLQTVEVAATEDSPSLAPLLERTVATLGRPDAFRVAADVWSRRGQPERARALLERVDASGLGLRPLLWLATSLLDAQAYERAEALFRELNARRWLPPAIRKDVVLGLVDVLTETGRESAAREVERREKARQLERKAARSDTFVRRDQKIGRNDPCPCGSGKKAKKCCGVPG